MWHSTESSLQAPGATPTSDTSRPKQGKGIRVGVSDRPSEAHGPGSVSIGTKQPRTGSPTISGTDLTPDDKSTLLINGRQATSQNSIFAPYGTSMISAHTIPEQSTIRQGIAPSRDYNGEGFVTTARATAGIPGMRHDFTMPPTSTQPDEFHETYLESADTGAVPNTATRDYVDIEIPLLSSSTHPPLAVPPIGNAGDNDTVETITIAHPKQSITDSKLVYLL